ncbi:hypothetical protein PVK06_030190 [Gossypium arboreum]|uniref:Uncharacterized protein n=1 Tax=Gossypium arboreum TaxID=29729 RepID=A0ABR0NML8_GOSAR|nr:hypothetical protein PVK06_030190 [Gossypium arboreum]
MDECVEPENVKVKEEAPYSIVEQQDLKVDIQQEMENGEMSEALGIIDEISNSSEESVEKSLHFLDTIVEIPHHKQIEDVPQQRNIQMEVENSKEVELVILPLMIP